MLLLMAASFLLISTSYMFTRIQHPLAMGLTLIIQTLLICISAGLLCSFTWLSYILFLIFLGATLVLFIYVASLASNEMFKMSYTMIVSMLAFNLLLLSLFFFFDELIQPLKPIKESSSLALSETIYNPMFSLSMIYNPSSSMITSFVILYLLLTLIVVVKITSSSKSPLRLS